MFTDFTGLASHFSRMRKEEEAAELAARREEARRRQEEKVVGGVYRPEPVNKEASMLLAKAPWYFHPPQEDQKFEKTIPKQEKTTMSTKLPPADYCAAGADQECLSIGKVNIFPRKVNGELMYSVDDMAKALIEHCKTVDPDLMKLSSSASDCRKAIDESIKDVGASIREFDRVTKDGMNEVRLKRMSIVSECSNMVNALKDVRQFFLGPDYERETKRLTEFVELCERMKALKDSGFLDTVADTMIRLASYEKA